MPIKRWADGFTSTVYRALYGTNTLKKIYYGSQLVFDTGSEFNYFDTKAGTRTITIPARGLYNIQLVGGGGGGSFTYFDYGGYWWSYGASGGSGSYVYGWRELEAGDYTITVGNAGSGFSAYYSSGSGGTGGTSSAFGESAAGGTGGSGSTHGSKGTASPYILTGKNGNDGVDRGTAYGAVSAPRTVTPYDNTTDGLGSGGDCGGSGGNGLVAVSYLGAPLSPMFEKSEPGTYTVTIPVTALYEVILVGGGGGAGRTWYYDRAYNIARAAGGSGACIKGKVKITAGTYTVVVGAGGTAGGDAHASTHQGGTGGSTSFLDQTATGGTGGVVWFENTVTGTQATAGTGGTVTTSSPYTGINGNNGTAVNNSWGVEPTVYGGASVYNGYGAGTADPNAPGGDGYISIRQLSGTAPTTFTVNPSPSDATVTFNSVPVDGIIARSGNTVTAYIGTQITYTVSKTGYTPKTYTTTLMSQSSVNVPLDPLINLTVTSTAAHPISSATYTINGGTPQTLTLTNNVGTIVCNKGETIAITAYGGNYNEADGASQGTPYTHTITNIQADQTETFNFAYEAWDDVYYDACRSAPGIGSNLAYIALDPSYLTYTAASNVQYIGIEVWDESMEGVDFPDVDHYHFRIKHGTTFNFTATIPDHSYGTTSEAYPGQYNETPLNYKSYHSMFMTAVDTITITLDDNDATVSNLTTTMYTRSGNTIKVIRGQTLSYTIYKDGHTQSSSYVNDDMLSAPNTSVSIPITVNTFMGNTITFNITPSGATITVDGTTLSGNTIYIYKDNHNNHIYTITKTDYDTVNGTLTYPTDIYTRTITITMQPSFTPETRTFSYTGAVQTYTIPQGTTKLIVDCVGAAAYDDTWGQYDPQYIVTTCGGRVQCTLLVSANQILYLYVGGRGTASGPGWNGGGTSTGTDVILGTPGASGGGATDIRIGGTSLNDRKIVAGAAGIGGAGGGLIGGSGSNELAGKGGTQTNGGAAGVSIDVSGTAGTFGIGGNGVHASPGGGGGWYGGGGGGYAGYNGNGSAGGGSSYTDPTLCTDVVHTQGYSAATGNGWITITTSNA